MISKNNEQSTVCCRHLWKLHLIKSPALTVNNWDLFSRVSFLYQLCTYLHQIFRLCFSRNYIKTLDCLLIRHLLLLPSTQASYIVALVNSFFKFKPVIYFLLLYFIMEYATKEWKMWIFLEFLIMWRWGRGWIEWNVTLDCRMHSVFCTETCLMIFCLIVSFTSWKPLF